MKLLRILPALFFAMFLGACSAEVETPGHVEVESTPEIEVEDKTPDVEIDAD